MDHTTLIVILSDGTHRTSQWYYPVKNEAWIRSLREHVQYLRDVFIVAAILVQGVQTQDFRGKMLTDIIKGGA